MSKVSKTYYMQIYCRVKEVQRMKMCKNIHTWTLQEGEKKLASYCSQQRKRRNQHDSPWGCCLLAADVFFFLRKTLSGLRIKSCGGKEHTCMQGKDIENKFCIIIFNIINDIWFPLNKEIELEESWIFGEG